MGCLIKYQRSALLGVIMLFFSHSVKSKKTAQNAIFLSTDFGLFKINKNDY